MSTPAYLNPALPVEERLADLLGRMTLEEKVGQLMLWDARSEDLTFINTYQPGSILHILGAKINRAIDLAAQNRLGIPLLVGEDGIHGFDHGDLAAEPLEQGRELDAGAQCAPVESARVLPQHPARRDHHDREDPAGVEGAAHQASPE